MLRRWENVTFRIFGMSLKDARTGVKDYVQLAKKITAENIDVNDIMEDLEMIGKDYPAEKAIGYLRETNCYDGWEDQLRYFLYRYEEYLAHKTNHEINEGQWASIWDASAADTIEHIMPQGTTADCVHWLGNLTILPPKTNSGLGDKAPMVKAETYRDGPLFVARDVGKRIGESGGWAESDILERENEMLEWAAGEWAD